MKDGVERPPALKPDEPAEVRAHERAARGREHQQNRHRKGADVEALEHDAKERHPGLGLAADGPVRGHGLGLGAGLGVGPKRRGVARFRGPLFAGVVHDVQHHLLADDVGGVTRGTDQEVVRRRQRRQEFRARQRLGVGARKYPDSENARRTADLRRPERVQARRGLGAGHDLPVHGRGPGGAGGLARGELHEPRGRGAGGGRASRRHERPEVRRFPQIVRGDVPEQERMKNALAGVGPQVPGKHRIGDLHAGDRIGEPRSEDHSVALIGEIVRQGERLLGEPREPVTDLGRDRGEERKPHRDVVHHRGRERRIQPIHDPHGGLRHDHRAPDRSEHQHPFGVVLPGAAEGGPEQDPGQPRDTRELGEREVRVAPGNGGDGVEQVHQVDPAAQGVEFVHIYAVPCPAARAIFSCGALAPGDPALAT